MEITWITKGRTRISGFLSRRRQRLRASLAGWLWDLLGLTGEFRKLEEELRDDVHDTQLNLENQIEMLRDELDSQIDSLRSEMEPE